MTQYSEKSYKMASDNTKYNAAGKAVILENDEYNADSSMPSCQNPVPHQ